MGRIGNNLQYAHTHTQEYSLPGTLVLTGTTKEHLHQMFIMHADQLMLMLGLSITSPNDHFIKKTGRELATKRIAPVPAELQGVSIEGTKHFYKFKTKMKVGFQTHEVFFTITTVAESDLVKLIDTYIPCF